VKDNLVGFKTKPPRGDTLESWMPAEAFVPPGRKKVWVEGSYRGVASQFAERHWVRIRTLGSYQDIASAMSKNQS
jgi:hypothetical protein